MIYSDSEPKQRRTGNGQLQRALQDAAAERLATVTDFRAAFAHHGFVVSHFTDDEICAAVLADMSQPALPPREYLAHVFQRLESAKKR